MANQMVKSLCGAYKVELVSIANHNPQDWFACPICKVGDTRENVLREVGEHAKEVAARYLQEGMRKAARNAKFITFSGKPVPQGNYRFVSDFKL